MLRRAKLLHALAKQKQSQSAGEQVHGAAQQSQSAGEQVIHGAAQQRQSARSSTDDRVQGVKRKLDLKGSPLMRLAAEQVGRRAAASTFGDMARAACSEAGTKNVSSGGSAMHRHEVSRIHAHACKCVYIQGTRYAAGLSVGTNRHNAERDVMAALRRSHGVPCRC